MQKYEKLRISILLAPNIVIYMLFIINWVKYEKPRMKY